MFIVKGVGGFPGLASELERGQSRTGGGGALDCCVC